MLKNIFKCMRNKVYLKQAFYIDNLLLNKYIYIIKNTTIVYIYILEHITVNWFWRYLLNNSNYKLKYNVNFNTFVQKKFIIITLTIIFFLI